MSRRMLITGGAGFIGTHLAEWFARARPAESGDTATVAAEPWNVRLFDNFRRDSLAYAPHLRGHERVEIVAGDVLDPQAVERAVADVDTVLHLAAIAGVSSYYKEPTRTLRVNIIGTAQLLDAVVRHKVKRFVHFSTSEVYGSEARDVTEEHNHGIGPVSDRRWVYATSKLAGEHLTLRYSEEHGFAATCVRPFNVYGPRQTGEGAISNFCAAAARGEPLTVYGDGSEIRAWCYVDDCVAAVNAMLEAPAAAGRAFNVGNPDGVATTNELAERLLKVAGGGRIERRPSGHVPIRYRTPNIDRAREVLGFRPRVGLDEGLARTLAWAREVER